MGIEHSFSFSAFPSLWVLDTPAADNKVSLDVALWANFTKRGMRDVFRCAFRLGNWRLSLRTDFNFMWENVFLSCDYLEIIVYMSRA